MSRGVVTASRSSSTGRVLAPALVLAAVLVAVLLGQSATSLVRVTQSPAGATLLPTEAEMGPVPAAPRVALAKPEGQGPSESSATWLALFAAGALLVPRFARRLTRLPAVRARLHLAGRCAAARAPPVSPIS